MSNMLFDWLNTIDHSLMLILNFDGGIVMDRICMAMSSKLIWIIPGMLFLRYVLRKCKWQDTVAILSCLVLTIVLCDQISSSWIKPTIMRLRPSHDATIQYALHYVGNYRGGLYGFVSSHAANAFGAVVFVSLVVHRKYTTIVLVLFASCVSYSRIYLGVHYPGDIVGGTLLGLVIGTSMYEVCCLLSKVWKYMSSNKHDIISRHDKYAYRI